MISSAVGCVPVVQHDDRVHRLAPHVVRDADHRDLRDGGMRRDRVLDLDRVHVLAAGDDHVLHPVDEEQVAVARRGSRRRRCGTSRRGTPRRSPRARFQYSRMKLPARAHTSPVSPGGERSCRRRPGSTAPRRGSGRPADRSRVAAGAVLLGAEHREHRRRTRSCRSPGRCRGRGTAPSRRSSNAARHRRRAVRERRAGSRAARAGTRVVHQHADHRRHHDRHRRPVCCSIASMHADRIEQRHEHRRAALGGTPRMPPIDAAWNIGVWCRYTSSVVESATPAPRGTGSASRPGGRAARPSAVPVVPPVYMRIDGIVLVGLVGDRGRGRREELLVVEVVRRVAVADHHHVLDADLATRPGRSRGAKNASVKHTLVPGVGEDELRAPSAPSRRFSGLMTPAPRNAAWYSSRNWWLFSAITAKRSPRPTPRSRNALARRVRPDRGARA